MKLLIIEDDETICRGVQKQILEMNLPELTQVDISLSAEEALACFQIKHHDLILTDIQMDGMNGLDLIEHAKKLCPDLVSLVLTAYAYFPYAQRAIELGVNAFLLKPCGRAELREALQKAIAERSKHITEKVSNACTAPVRYAQNYVRNHLNEEINMAVLANQLNFSYSYFSKLYKQETGQSFLNYIVQQKMEEAARMIVNGMKTSEAAALLGYKSAQNFNRAFQNYWKCTPSEYRARFFPK